MTARLLAIGLGTADRGDDAVGLHVAGLVEAAAPDGVTVIALAGDPLALLDRWDAADRVVLVDAAAPATRPGRIHRLDPLATKLPPELARASTHAFGLAATLDLARALGRLPARLIIFAIEAESVALGAPLSRPVAAAARRLVPRVVGELAGQRRAA